MGLKEGARMFCIIRRGLSSGYPWISWCQGTESQADIHISLSAYRSAAVVCCERSKLGL